MTANIFTRPLAEQTEWFDSLAEDFQKSVKGSSFLGFMKGVGFFGTNAEAWPSLAYTVAMNVVSDLEHLGYIILSPEAFKTSGGELVSDENVVPLHSEPKLPFGD